MQTPVILASILLEWGDFDYSRVLAIYCLKPSNLLQGSDFQLG